MAFTEVQSLDADTVVALGGNDRKTGKKNATSVEGYYLGSKKIESRKAKSGFAYIHIFQTPKGNLGVWGKTDSDRKILTVTPGTMTKVEFSGMKPTPNGDMYTYRVLVDNDNTIEVNLHTESAPAEESYFPSDNFVANDATEEEPAYEEEVVPAPKVAVAAAERQARVQALLSKNKR